MIQTTGNSKHFLKLTGTGNNFLVDVGRNRGGGMAEDQMFDDLENMLGSKNTGAPSVAKLS